MDDEDSNCLIIWGLQTKQLGLVSRSSTITSELPTCSPAKQAWNQVTEALSQRSHRKEGALNLEQGGKNKNKQDT